MTVEEVERVAPIYLPRLFDPKLSRTSLVCNPAKVDEIRKGFMELGVELEVLESVDDMIKL